MAMEAQLQIRQNASEVQDYMKELFDWEKSMKMKDKAISNAESTGINSRTLPAPRGRALSKISEAPQELQQPNLPTSASAKQKQPKKAKSSDQTAVNGSAAAHTYTSYSKWDRLDVDAMLASSSSSETEEDGHARRQSKQQQRQQQQQQQQPSTVVPAPHQLSTSSPPSMGTAHSPGTKGLSTHTSVAQPTPAPADEHPLPPIRNAEPQTADDWRKRGNGLFKAGQHASARECYTRSIILEPSATAYANRAAAHLKLNDWQSVIDDCGDALELDPTFIKAYHRRATAYRHLGQHYEAAQDFEEALRLEPTNLSVQADRDACLAAYMQSVKLQPLSKRVPIPIEILHPRPSQPAPQASTANTATSAAAGGMLAAQPGSLAGQASAAPSTAQAPTSFTSAALSDTKHLDSAPTQAARSSTSPATSPKTSPTSSSIAAAAAAAAEQLSSKVVQKHQPPKTSTEFENTWRSLRGDLTLQASYLQIIQPSQLPFVFKSSLTVQILVAVLRTLLAGMSLDAAALSAAALADGISKASAAEGHATASHAVPVQFGVEMLENMTQVPRFDMAAMCISSREKAELSALWQAAADAMDMLYRTRMDAVRKKYRL